MNNYYCIHLTRGKHSSLLRTLVNDDKNSLIVYLPGVEVNFSAAFRHEILDNFEVPASPGPSGRGPTSRAGHDSARIRIRNPALVWCRRYKTFFLRY